MGNEILVSLGDSGLKDIAEVLGSRSCVRILDLLAVENLAVSDVARRLEMKINTADYNVKKLVRAGLIEKADHWWSVKGRRMIVYRVADKRIVISPRRNVAKKFLWVLGLTGITALFVRSREFGVRSNELGSGGVKIMEEAVFSAVPEAEISSVNAVANDMMIRSVESVGFWSGLAGFEWFLLGAWSAIVLFFVYSLAVERRR